MKSKTVVSPIGIILILDLLGTNGLARKEQSGRDSYAGCSPYF